MTVEAFDLRTRADGRLVRIAWDSDSGELFGPEADLARLRADARLAVELGDVPVDPVPCRVDITDPFRDRVQLAALLYQAHILPPALVDAIAQAVAAQDDGEEFDADADVVF